MQVPPNSPAGGNFNIQASQAARPRSTLKADLGKGGVIQGAPLDPDLSTVEAIQKSIDDALGENAHQGVTRMRSSEVRVDSQGQTVRRYHTDGTPNSHWNNAQPKYEQYFLDNGAGPYLKTVIEHYVEVERQVPDPANPGQTKAVQDVVLVEKEVWTLVKVPNKADMGKAEYAKAMNQTVSRASRAVRSASWGMKAGVMASSTTDAGKAWQAKQLGVTGADAAKLTAIRGKLTEATAWSLSKGGASGEEVKRVGLLGPESKALGSVERVKGVVNYRFFPKQGGPGEYRKVGPGFQPPAGTTMKTKGEMDALMGGTGKPWISPQGGSLNLDWDNRSPLDVTTDSLDQNQNVDGNVDGIVNSLSAFNYDREDFAESIGILSENIKELDAGISGMKDEFKGRLPGLEEADRLNRAKHELEELDQFDPLVDELQNLQGALGNAMRSCTQQVNIESQTLAQIDQQITQTETLLRQEQKARDAYISQNKNFNPQWNENVDQPAQDGLVKIKNYKQQLQKLQKEKRGVLHKINSALLVERHAKQEHLEFISKQVAYLSDGDLNLLTQRLNSGPSQLLQSFGPSTNSLQKKREDETKFFFNQLKTIVSQEQKLRASGGPGGQQRGHAYFVQRQLEMSQRVQDLESDFAEVHIDPTQPGIGQAKNAYNSKMNSSWNSIKKIQDQIYIFSQVPMDPDLEHQISQMQKQLERLTKELHSVKETGNEIDQLIQQANIDLGNAT